MTKEKLTVFLSLLLFGISVNAADLDSDKIVENLINKNFLLDKYEIGGELTSTPIPKADISFETFDNKHGALSARYQLTGKSKDVIALGSFAATQVDSELPCNDKWSCNNAIYACLEDGKVAQISIESCPSTEAQYCISCQ